MFFYGIVIISCFSWLSGVCVGDSVVVGICELSFFRGVGLFWILLFFLFFTMDFWGGNGSPLLTMSKRKLPIQTPSIISATKGLDVTLSLHERTSVPVYVVHPVGPDYQAALHRLYKTVA